MRLHLFKKLFKISKLHRTIWLSKPLTIRMAKRPIISTTQWVETNTQLLSSQKCSRIRICNCKLQSLRNRGEAATNEATQKTIMPQLRKCQSKGSLRLGWAGVRSAAKTPKDNLQTQQLKYYRGTISQISSTKFKTFRSNRLCFQNPPPRLSIKALRARATSIEKRTHLPSPNRMWWTRQRTTFTTRRKERKLVQLKWCLKPRSPAATQPRSSSPQPAAVNQAQRQAPPGTTSPPSTHSTQPHKLARK